MAKGRQTHAVSLKLDSLSQREGRAVVDGTCGSPHVLLPGVAARLPATASVLLSAKRTTNLSPAGRNIDVHDATVGTFRSKPAEDSAQIFGKDTT